MRSLIYGHHNDEHAQSVRWALERDGLSCSIFCSDEFPVNSTISLHPESGKSWISGSSILACLDDFDVVWNRRNKPAVVSADLHDDDRNLAQLESTKFLRDLRLSWPSHGQTWINEEYAQRLMSSKPLQLRLASELGLKIPNTIISNDPAKVRSFFADHGSIIVKAVDKMAWEIDDGQLTLPTTLVDDISILEDISIKSCPMIYQERITKKYELRIVMFGDHAVAVRLDSQSSPYTALDWRLAQPEGFDISEVEIPNGLLEKLRLFCRKSRILHGSFDLAVDRNDNIIFFEINVQGQSLWLESWNPDIRILDRLSQFMANPTRNFSFDRKDRHSFIDFLSQEFEECKIK